MSPSAAVLGLLVILEGHMRLTAIASYQDRDVRPTPPVSRNQQSPADAPPVMWRLHIQDPYLQESARRVVGEAADWLSFPQCQLLLSDYADQRGRELTGKLTELGVTAAEYSEIDRFRGRDDAGCLQATRHPGIHQHWQPGHLPLRPGVRARGSTWTRGDAGRNHPRNAALAGTGRESTIQQANNAPGEEALLEVKRNAWTPVNGRRYRKFSIAIKSDVAMLRWTRIVLPSGETARRAGSNGGATRPRTRVRPVEGSST